MKNVTSKTEDLNLSIFNMITGITELKTLTKYILCECKYKFDEKKSNQMNGEITINVNMSVKNTIYMKKIVQNPATCNCENKKCLSSIMDDSRIICQEVIRS